MEHRTVLITGFEPFGGETVNPSWEAVKALPDRVRDWQLKKLCIPVEYGRAAEIACRAAEETGAQVILCIGQAGGRAAVTPEVIGINLREASIPDNAGVPAQGVPIDETGPDAYFSTVPVRDMVRAIQEAGIPGNLSYSAGAYVCNDVLYTLLHRMKGTGIRVGFIHVPYLPQQGSPNLPLEAITSALEAAVAAL